MSEKLIGIISNCYKNALILMTSSMFLIVGSNVFCRFFLNSSIGWADEMSRFIFIWISFLGAVWAYVESEHVGLNFLVSKIPSRKIQLLVALISEFLILLVCIIIAYYGYIVANSATNVSPALYLPMKYIYAVVPVSGLMLVLICLAKIKKNFNLFMNAK